MLKFAKYGVLLYHVLAVFCQSQQESKYKSCQLTEGTNGTCVPLDICVTARRLLQMKLTEVLRKQTCGFEGYTPWVCCIEDNLDHNDVINFNETSHTTLRPRKSKTPTPTNTTTTTTTTTVSRTPTNKPPYEANFPNNEKKGANETVNIETKDVNGTIPTPDIITHSNTGDEDSEISMLPDRKYCGIQSSIDTRIIGGVPTDITEFPWVVRIKYKLPNGSEVFGCSGTLINKYYILTAAHCVTGLMITSVRLGEWDMETERDCVQGVCNNPPVDQSVLNYTVHPNHTHANFSHDIALIRLQDPVNYTDFIRPICLPTTDYVARQDYIPEETGYVTAGWGRTEFGPSSAILRKIELKAVGMPICKTSHETMQVSDEPNIICAGGRKGEDTCEGDSGGGLFKAVKEDSDNNCFIFGITSYGSKNCGAEAIPSIYTRVTTYMKWILDSIEQ